MNIHDASILVLLRKNVQLFVNAYPKPKSRQIIMANLSPSHAYWTPCSNEIPLQVVVVGGGFAGILAARTLAEECRAAGLDACVTVVDQKDYFEYTPAVLRALVDPSECDTILVPLRDTCLPSSGVLFPVPRLPDVLPLSAV